MAETKDQIFQVGEHEVSRLDLDEKAELLCPVCGEPGALGWLIKGLDQGYFDACVECAQDEEVVAQAVAEIGPNECRCTFGYCETCIPSAEAD